MLRRALLLALPLCCACATPGARYFSGEGQGQSCEEIRAARAYADAHPDLPADRRADLLADAAHCEVVAGHPENAEPLLAEAVKLDPKQAAAADAERAALLARKGEADAAVATFQQALDAGFADLDQVFDDEFDKLRALPALERPLVILAASAEPVAPRVQALAEHLQQRPVTPVVVEANPDYGLHTFVVWRGRVLESHYDANNNETTILLEEVAAHEHSGDDQGEAHQHYEVVWDPTRGFSRQPHEHLHEDGESHIEYEATGRLFGLRVTGFNRELVEAPDLEVVGYYVGRSPFLLKGETGEAPTLDVIRAVPFNSGVHLGTPVAHER